MRQESSPATFRHRYRLTRLGIHFVFVAAFTMIGGALRGFNLLLVLSGMLIAALLFQWRCSRRVIRSSAVLRLVPTEAYANVPFRIRYQVNNLSRYLPVWMLRIDDQIESSAQDRAATAGCGVGIVRPGSIATAFCDCVVTCRGRYRFGPVALSTLFPFSLMSARKIVDAQEEVYVYPEMLSLRKGWQQMLATKQGGAATAARRSGPQEGDFFGLREWQNGDNPRWIHHRTTARLGEPFVRQFEQQRQYDACLIVDCFQPSSNRPNDADAVETAISFAATIVMSMDRAPSSQLVVALADANPNAASGDRTRSGKLDMLRLLADAKPTSESVLVRGIDQAVKLAGYAKDLVVISTRDLQDLLDDDEDRDRIAKCLRNWVRRAGLRWMNVRSAEFQYWLINRPPAANTSPLQSAARSGAQAQEAADVVVD